MTDKQARVFAIINELKNMDLEGVLLITFEEYETVRNKRDWVISIGHLISGICIGILIGVGISKFLK